MKLVVSMGLYSRQIGVKYHTVCLDIDGGLGIAATLRVRGWPVVLTMRAWGRGKLPWAFVRSFSPSHPLVAPSHVTVGAHTPGRAGGGGSPHGVILQLL